MAIIHRRDLDIAARDLQLEEYAESEYMRKMDEYFAELADADVDED